MDCLWWAKRDYFFQDQLWRWRIVENQKAVITFKTLERTLEFETYYLRAIYSLFNSILNPLIWQYKLYDLNKMHSGEKYFFLWFDKTFYINQLGLFYSFIWDSPKEKYLYKSKVYMYMTTTLYKLSCTKSLWSFIEHIFITQILILRGLIAQQRHHHDRLLTGYIRRENTINSQTKIPF